MCLSLILRLSRRGRAKRVCASAFPGIISARNIVYADVPACTNHGTAAEGGANAYPGGAAERRENASPCAAPESGYASGSAVDRSARVKERAAEGDAHAGASPAARMRMPSDAGPFRLLKKNRLVKISYTRPPPR